MDDTQPQRRWYRLHWRTWFATVLVGITFVILQYGGSRLLHFTLREPWSYGQSGWPLISSSPLNHSYTHPTPPSQRTENTVRMIPLARWINFATVVMVIASTAFVVERWCRRGRWFQIRLAGMLQTMASGAIVFVVFHNYDAIAAALWWKNVPVDHNLDLENHVVLAMLGFPAELMAGDVYWEDITVIFTDPVPDVMIYLGISTLLCVLFIAGIWCTVHASLLGLISLASVLIHRVAHTTRHQDQPPLEAAAKRCRTADTSGCVPEANATPRRTSKT